MNGQCRCFSGRLYGFPDDGGYLSDFPFAIMLSVHPQGEKKMNEEQKMTFDNQKIVNVDINKEMKKSFLDYSMSVITSRACVDYEF